MKSKPFELDVIDNQGTIIPLLSRIVDVDHCIMPGCFRGPMKMYLDPRFPVDWMEERSLKVRGVMSIGAVYEELWDPDASAANPRFRKGSYTIREVRDAMATPPLVPQNVDMSQECPTPTSCTPGDEFSALVNDQYWFLPRPDAQATQKLTTELVGFTGWQIEATLFEDGDTAKPTTIRQRFPGSDAFVWPSLDAGEGSCVMSRRYWRHGLTWDPFSPSHPEVQKSTGLELYRSPYMTLDFSPFDSSSPTDENSFADAIGRDLIRSPTIKKASWLECQMKCRDWQESEWFYTEIVENQDGLATVECACLYKAAANKITDFPGDYDTFKAQRDVYWSTRNGKRVVKETFVGRVNCVPLVDAIEFQDTDSRSGVWGGEVTIHSRLREERAFPSVFVSSADWPEGDEVGVSSFVPEWEDPGGHIFSSVSPELTYSVGSSSKTAYEGTAQDWSIWHPEAYLSDPLRGRNLDLRFTIEPRPEMNTLWPLKCARSPSISLDRTNYDLRSAAASSSLCVPVQDFVASIPPPSMVTFIDADMSIGLISGKIIVHPPSPTSSLAQWPDVDAYEVYYSNTFMPQKAPNASSSAGDVPSSWGATADSLVEVFFIFRIDVIGRPPLDIVTIKLPTSTPMPSRVNEVAENANIKNWKRNSVFIRVVAVSGSQKSQYGAITQLIDRYGMCIPRKHKMENKALLHWTPRFYCCKFDSEGGDCLSCVGRFSAPGSAIDQLPTSATFTDEDEDGGEISGLLKFTRASDESDFQDYCVYSGVELDHRRLLLQCLAVELAEEIAQQLEGGDGRTVAIRILPNSAVGETSRITITTR
eukprot:GHVT01104976.1.p1 GENE.GHVT01104976.1~~GHVT01104976.1.p1  ORF type:complete len:817 (-),score=70.55 GHVT01104976.1:1170-3620(-)